MTVPNPEGEGTIEITEARLNGIGNRFDNESDNDLTIICQDERFPCSSSLLVASSNVFQSMLSNKQHTFEINDISSQAVKVMLEYLYTEYLPIDVVSIFIIVDLLVLCERYQFSVSLKLDCEEQLIGILDEDNVNEYLDISTKYKLSKLKDACEKQIILNDTFNEQLNLNDVD